MNRVAHRYLVYGFLKNTPLMIPTREACCLNQAEATQLAGRWIEEDYAVHMIEVLSENFQEEKSQTPAKTRGGTQND